MLEIGIMNKNNISKLTNILKKIQLLNLLTIICSMKSLILQMVDI